MKQFKYQSKITNLMEALPTIEIRDLALYLKESNSLVIGDVHLGFEEALGRQGVLVPRFQYKDIEKRLSEILKGLPRLNEIIINGDLKHEFGSITRQEWTDIGKLIDFLLLHCEKVVLVKGNHDVILFPIARKKGIEVIEYHTVGDIYICHGHLIPADKDFMRSKIIIMGNEHPAVSVRDGARSETFKCFAFGKFKDKKLIAMPSFNPLTIGTDLLKEKFLSPFLHQDLLGFEIYVVADNKEVLHFGKLKNLKKS
jgi:uncharacterized protein